MHIQVINSDVMPVHMMTCHVLVCLSPECYKKTKKIWVVTVGPKRLSSGRGNLGS